jgi:hypothetical protein
MGVRLVLWNYGKNEVNKGISLRVVQSKLTDVSEERITSILMVVK